GPEESISAGAQHPFRSKVEQHRTEKRLGDPDAAEDEILPGRLDGGRRPVERDQQDRGQGGQFHRDPEDTEVVGHQGDQHGEDEQLEHGVIKTHPQRADLAMLPLDPHVTAAEDRGGGGDQGGKNDQGDVQLIDEEIGRTGNAPPLGIDLQRQHQRGREGEQRAADIDLWRVLPVADKGQQRSRNNRYAEQGEEDHRLVRFLQFGHLIDIQTVKGRVDVEEEDAEDKGCYQQVERHPQLYDHRHAVGGAGGGKEQAVFHGQETEDLRDRMATGD